jgi:hypothetical protein
MDQYEAEVKCEISTCGGDVDSVSTFGVSNQTLLELVVAVFPTIRDRLDAISEIRLTFTMREK